MAQAVKNAYLILMFVSSNYEKSENCRREGSLAADRKKRIIPIKTQSDFEPDDWLSMNFIFELILSNRTWSSLFLMKFKLLSLQRCLEHTGLIIAGKLYYNFGEGSFDEKFKELLKEIGKRLATLIYRFIFAILVVK